MTSQTKLVQNGAWGYSAGAEAVGDYSGPVTLTTTNSNSTTVTITGSGTVFTSVTPSTSLSQPTYQVVNDVLNVVAEASATTGNTVQLTNQGAAFVAIFNGGAQTLLVYPPTGGTINAAAANIGFGIAAGKSTTFMAPDTTALGTVPGLTWFAAHAG